MLFFEDGTPAFLELIILSLDTNVEMGITWNYYYTL